MTIQQTIPGFYIAHTHDGIWASGDTFTDAIANLLSLIFS